MVVLIYGKDSCRYTADAREHFGSRGDVRYLNVKKDAEALRQMLGSGGQRRVPVIVEDGKVTIGFGGT